VRCILTCTKRGCQQDASIQPRRGTTAPTPRPRNPHVSVLPAPSSQSPAAPVSPQAHETSPQCLATPRPQATQPPNGHLSSLTCISSNIVQTCPLPVLALSSQLQAPPCALRIGQWHAPAATADWRSTARPARHLVSSGSAATHFTSRKFPKKALSLAANSKSRQGWDEQFRFSHPLRSNAPKSGSVVASTGVTLACTS
jgi:hypothetical protein